MNVFQKQLLLKDDRSMAELSNPARDGIGQPLPHKKVSIEEWCSVVSEVKKTCYWCKHPDHGESVCAVPYTAIDEKGITNSYPCGCPRSTVIDAPAREAAYEIIGLMNPDVDRVEQIILKYFGAD